MREKLNKLVSRLRSVDFNIICVSLAAAIVIFFFGFFTGTRFPSRSVIISSIPEAETLTQLENAEEQARNSESSVTPLSENGRVNINTADILELTHIPGVGEVTARKIAAYREEHGAFTVIEEIMLVPGIGEKKFDSMKAYITV